MSDRRPVLTSVEKQNGLFLLNQKKVWARIISAYRFAKSSLCCIFVPIKQISG